MERILQEIMRNSPVYGQSSQRTVERPSGDLILPELYMGIECELENCVIQLPSCPWHSVGDGSLRGAGAYEYVTDVLKGRALVDAVHQLEHLINYQGLLPNTNERTSTHFHLNVQDFTRRQLLSLVATFIAVEPIMLSLFPEERRTSNYCVPFSRRPSDLRTYSLLFSSYSRGNILTMLQRLGKYASFNILPIKSFGSVEVRYFPGEYRAETLLLWIRLLQRIVRFSLENADNVELLPMLMSSRGVYEFLYNIFEADIERLNFYDDYQEDILESVRDAQFILNVDPNSNVLMEEIRKEFGKTGSETEYANYHDRVMGMECVYFPPIPETGV